MDVGLLIPLPFGVVCVGFGHGLLFVVGRSTVWTPLDEGWDEEVGGGGQEVEVS